MSQLNVNTITNLDETGGPVIVGVTTVSGNFNVTGASTISGLTYPTAGALSNRNKIINGDMRIDQRNAGASVTINTSAKTYTVDRWHANGQTSDGVFTVQQSTTAPTGFTNSLLATVTTADASIGVDQYYLLCQRIEGYNVADLGFGSAAAKTVTLSFWVRSSLTGTFSGALENSAENRSYPFTYSISSADTWEQKTITIAGDTSGTWLTDNGIGLFVWFDLGCGSNKRGTAGAWTGSNLYGATGAVQLIATNGATFYITGVQLEAGSVATPFERRSYGQELALCQRYYYRATSNGAASDLSGIGSAATTTVARIQTMFPVEMRVPPTSVEQTGTAADYTVRTLNTPVTCSAVPSFWNATTQNATTNLTVASGLVAGNGCTTRTGTSGSAFLGWSAEL